MNEWIERERERGFKDRLLNTCFFSIFSLSLYSEEESKPERNFQSNVERVSEDGERKAQNFPFILKNVFLSKKVRMENKKQRKVIQLSDVVLNITSILSSFPSFTHSFLLRTNTRRRSKICILVIFSIFLSCHVKTHVSILFTQSRIQKWKRGQRREKMEKREREISCFTFCIQFSRLT